MFEPRETVDKPEDPPEIARKKGAEWRIEAPEDLAISHALVKRAAAAIRTASREACLGFEAAVVLGHADYYPRFGFLSASSFGLVSEYDVPDDVFMALELRSGALRGYSGTSRRCRYPVALQVIPVLVNGAYIPRREDLPEDIRQLSNMQAIEVTDARWEFDMGAWHAQSHRRY